MKTKLQKLAQTAKEYVDGNTNVRASLEGRGAIRELAVAFNELADRLNASDEMRREFISNVSHDMKTPMTVINGYVTNIMSGAIPKEEENKYLERIQKETMRLSALVGLYLDVSRIDSDDWRYTFTDFDISEVIGNNISVFFDKIESKGLDGDFETPGDLSVYADYDAVSRVMYCLIDNAVKFTPKGQKMLISVSRKNDKVYVSVYNEGDGIPYEDQPYVFDRSFKGDRSRGLEKDSFGLGLYICKKILDAHGTDLKLESTPGKDCRFSFELPLSKETGLR